MGVSGVDGKGRTMTFPPMSRSHQFKAQARSKEQLPPGSEYYARTRIRTKLERPVHPDVERGLRDSLGAVAYRTLKESIGIRVVGEEEDEESRRGGGRAVAAPPSATSVSGEEGAAGRKGLFEEVFGKGEYPDTAAGAGKEGTLGAWLDRYGRPKTDLRVTAGFSKCKTHTSKFDRFRTIQAAHNAKQAPPPNARAAPALAVADADLPPANY